MIHGTVSPDLLAIIPLSVQSTDGTTYQFDALIDTGFNGSVTLPVSVITALGLNWHSRGQATLANGSLEDFDIYAGRVLWDGQARQVYVEAVEGSPLVGMLLLRGYDLHIEAIDGGAVTITRHQLLRRT